MVRTKMGRPPKRDEDKFSVAMSLKMTERDAGLLRRLVTARGTGATPSDVLRDLIRLEAARLGIRGA
jgi:hypothetical protein